MQKDCEWSSQGRSNCWCAVSTRNRRVPRRTNQPPTTTVRELSGNRFSSPGEPPDESGRIAHHEKHTTARGRAPRGRKLLARWGTSAAESHSRSAGRGPGSRSRDYVGEFLAQCGSRRSGEGAACRNSRQETLAGGGRIRCER